MEPWRASNTGGSMSIRLYHVQLSRVKGTFAGILMVGCLSLWVCACSVHGTL